MSHKDGTMIFQLSRPLQYSKGGEFQQAEFLEFSEYSGAHRKQYYRLRQFVMQVMMEASEMDEIKTHAASKPFLDQSEEDHKFEADAMAEAMEFSFTMSNKVDLEAFVSIFQKMICHERKKLCSIEGDIHLKDSNFEDMSPDDQLNAAVKYCCFFGIGLPEEMMIGPGTSTTSPTPAKEL